LKLFQICKLVALDFLLFVFFEIQVIMMCQNVTLV